MAEPTYKRVARVIGELAGLDPATIGPGQSLGQRHSPNFYWQSLHIVSEPPKPIGLDSLDLIQLAMALEEEFGITISDEEVDSPAIDHVGGLVAFVQGKLDAKWNWYVGHAWKIPQVVDKAALRQPKPSCSTCGATDPGENSYCSNGFHFTPRLSDASEDRVGLCAGPFGEPPYGRSVHDAYHIPRMGIGRHLGPSINPELEGDGS